MSRKSTDGKQKLQFPSSPSSPSSSKSVFVTVGTTSFDALIEALDDLSVIDTLRSKGYGSLTLQVGRGSYTPRCILPPECSRAVLGGGGTGDDEFLVECFDFRPSLDQAMKVWVALTPGVTRLVRRGKMGGDGSSLSPVPPPPPPPPPPPQGRYRLSSTVDVLLQNKVCEKCQPKVPTLDEGGGLGGFARGGGVGVRGAGAGAPAARGGGLAVQCSC